MTLLNPQTTVKELISILEDLPKDYFVNGNQMGNLVIYDENLIPEGWIDLGTDKTYNLFL